MDSKKLRSVGALLGHPGSRLQRIVERARARQDLCRRVRAQLAAELSDHLVDVSAEVEGSAVVTLDSAAWAARLRYDDGPLRAALQAAGLPVRTVRVRVAPPGRDAAR